MYDRQGTFPAALPSPYRCQGIARRTTETKRSGITDKTTRSTGELPRTGLTKGSRIRMG